MKGHDVKPVIRTYHEVWENTDKSEGKGRSKFTGICFTTRSEAVKFAKSDTYAELYGVMGTKGGDYDVVSEDRAIYMCADDVSAKNQRKIDKRNRALAKLTDEDRKLLGLD